MHMWNHVLAEWLAHTYSMLRSGVKFRVGGVCIVAWS